MNLAALMPIIEILADGQAHSGRALGQRLGITRAAVWKQIRALDAYGLTVSAGKATGYRIPGGLDLLDSGALASLATELGIELHFFPELPSTNSWLLQSKVHQGAVCIAEYQNAGRGRRGRAWISPLARTICFSMCLRSSAGISALEGLSLAVGAVVAEALTDLGALDMQLKWPNDLLAQGRKLGGILIEIGGDLAGECHAVIGLGLNVSNDPATAIDQPWINLREAGVTTSRTALAIELIKKLNELVLGYPDAGLDPFRELWLARAAFVTQAVTLSTPSGKVSGVMSGIDRNGGIVLTLPNGEREVYTGGEISLRSNQ